jgi:hypothetical protein
VPVSTTIDHQLAVHRWRGRVRRFRLRAVAYAASLGVRLHSGRAEMHTTSVPFLRWMTVRWRARAHVYALVRAQRFPALMCIHRLEGSWVAYSSAGYYGGFQMSATFMRHWGPDKLAKYGGRDARFWSPGDQLAVASRAVAHLGFSPWPNTASACGL